MIIMVNINNVKEIKPEILKDSKRIHLINKNTDATKFGMMIVSVNPKAPPHVPYHFHMKML